MRNRNARGNSLDQRRHRFGVWLVSLGLCVAVGLVPARGVAASASHAAASPGGETSGQPDVAAEPEKPADAKPAAKKPSATKTATPKPTTGTAAPAAADDSPATAGEAGAPGPASGAALSPEQQRQSEIYGDRLDGLQTDVDQLKDRIFRSKARLTLLKETVLRGVLAGSRVILAHRNLMGSTFRLVRLVYIMDGAQIYARTDETGSLDAEDELVIYDGNLPPGPHNVTIELTYKGHGYGVFQYLTGMTFESRSSHSFTAPENGAVKLTSVGFEAGNLTTEMRDRPKIDWQDLPLDASGRPLPRARRRKNGAKRSRK